MLLPTGAKANCVFVVGPLTETEDEYWQGRVVDPTGTFFVYAGQYQPEAAGMLREAEPLAFVAVVGKPRTDETNDGTVTVSLRPAHLPIMDEAAWHRWGNRNRRADAEPSRNLRRFSQRIRPDGPRAVRRHGNEIPRNNG